MAGENAVCKEIINGYHLTAPWTTSGSAQWTYAEKDGQEWFLKRFLAPKYKRTEDGIPQNLVDRANARCEVFRNAQEMLYQRVRSSDTGNIVSVSDFFRFGTSFYAASPRIPRSEVSAEEISRLPEEKRILLMKILTHSIQNLHANRVVHADLKPSNIILKRTASGGYTLKLIDFDASFLEEAPRSGEDIAFDPVYVAPETIQAMSDSTVRLTAKIDVFALGLIFHLYYCGCHPVLPDGCPHAVHAIANGDPVELSEKLPQWLKTLIGQMIQLDPEQRPSAAVVFQWLQEQKQPSEHKSAGGFHKPPAL